MDTAPRSGDVPPMPGLAFRRASAADALFEAWDREPHIRAAVCEDGGQGFGADWPRELEDERIAYIIVFDGAGPSGFLAIVDPAADPYWGEMPPGLRAVDIVIGDPDRLDPGLGTRMMHWALERCFADASIDAVLVDPLATNERAIRFYRRLGFGDGERRRFSYCSDCLVLRQDDACLWTFRT